MNKIITSIFKTFFLSLCIIATVNLSHAQTASILPPAKTTFVDQNGKPLTSGTVDFYIPSTTTRKTTWQDAGETIPNTNPVVLDAAGRALILGSGSYRQVVKDRLGNIIWDQATSSTGSGGGSTPTATGDGDLVGTVKPWAGMTAPNQYVFTYGQEVSRTTFSVLFTAITSTQSAFCTSGSAVLTGLADTTNFPINGAIETSCVVSGNTTVVSKTSSSVTMAVNSNITTNANILFLPWGGGNHSTTFNLPDLRGLTLFGNAIMGGVATGNNLDIFFANSPGAATLSSVGQLGGTDANVLATANLPPQTPVGTVSSSLSGATATTPIRVFTTTTPTSDVTHVSAGNSTGADAGTISSPVTGTVTSTFTGTAFSGQTSTAFSNNPPGRTINYIIKITPDVNSAIASGVTSLGGMTGSIACGSGITCTGNTISSTSGAGTFTNLNVSGLTTLGTNASLPSGTIAGISNNTATAIPAMPGFAPQFVVTGADDARGEMALQTFTNSGGESSYLMFTARGTQASPAASQSGDFIGEVFAHPCAGATPCAFNHNAGAGFIWVTTENTTATNAGEKITWWTTPTTTATAAFAGTFEASGAITIGAPTGGDCGLGCINAQALKVNNVNTLVNGGALGSPSSIGTLPAFTLSGNISGGGNQLNNTVIGNVSPQPGAFTNIFATRLTTTPTVVGSLPTCNGSTDGMRLFVTDNNTAVSFGGAVTTGGTTHSPVYCDGSASAWKQG